MSESIQTTEPHRLILRCPDCSNSIGAFTSASVSCRSCNRTFEFNNGILGCLPKEVHKADVKERESAGWQKVYPETLEEVRDFYLQFPYISEDNGSHFYADAARQLEIVMQMLGSLEGKCGLDIGGGFGWAAYRFSKNSASMTLADFNDSTPSGLGGAQIFEDAGYDIKRVRVDAEELPFSDEQFDFVFCCSFLHHLTRPELALQHIARVLKPGGNFFAIMEAFCPFWSSREKALHNAQNIDTFTDAGINEQVFTQREYKRWFHRSGLRLSIINPRWDEIDISGDVLTNKRLERVDYNPECLTNRMNQTNVSGRLARVLLETGLWRIAAQKQVFHLLRSPLLQSTQKLRILCGQKT